MKGIKNVRRDMPADFPDVCMTMKRFELQKHYGCSSRILMRWFEELGMRYARRGPGPRPAPHDFAERAPTMTRKALRRHYRTSDELIVRWLEEAGIQPVTRAKPKPAAIRPPRRTYVAVSDRVITIFDEAADVLRRERFAVYRSNERGGADQAGEFWRVGNSVLTPDELLMKADRYRRRAA